VTSVVVTHDLHSALAIGTRIAMLYQGQVVEVATPQQFIQSKQRVRARLSGSTIHHAPRCVGRAGSGMKKSQMQQNAMEVMVGAFMFMILLTLGFFTIVLSQENWLSTNYRWTCCLTTSPAWSTATRCSCTAWMWAA
jgi:ABC-type proline/glycine betaine transport system ATPase subunit